MVFVSFKTPPRPPRMTTHMDLHTSGAPWSIALRTFLITNIHHGMSRTYHRWELKATKDELNNNDLPTDIRPRRPVSLKPANCAEVVYSAQVCARYTSALTIPSLITRWDGKPTRPVRDQAQDRLFYVHLRQHGSSCQTIRWSACNVLARLETTPKVTVPRVNRTCDLQIEKLVLLTIRPRR